MDFSLISLEGLQIFPCLRRNNTFQAGLRLQPLQVLLLTFILA